VSRKYAGLFINKNQIKKAVMSEEVKGLDKPSAQKSPTGAQTPPKKVLSRLDSRSVFRTSDLVAKSIIVKPTT